MASSGSPLLGATIRTSSFREGHGPQGSAGSARSNAQPVLLAVVPGYLGLTEAEKAGGIVVENVAFLILVQELCRLN